MLRACLAGLRLLQKQLRLRLLRWSGFSGGAGAVLENIWQHNFTCWIEVVKSLNCPLFSSFSFLFFFSLSLLYFSFPFFPPILLSSRHLLPRDSRRPALPPPPPLGLLHSPAVARAPSSSQHGSPRLLLIHPSRRPALPPPPPIAAPHASSSSQSNGSHRLLLHASAASHLLRAAAAGHILPDPAGRAPRLAAGHLVPASPGGSPPATSSPTPQALAAGHLVPAGHAPADPTWGQVWQRVAGAARSHQFLAPPRVSKPRGAPWAAPRAELVHNTPFGRAPAEAAFGAAFGALP